MNTQTTYTQARASPARLLDMVTQDHDIVTVGRGRGEDVAPVASHELSSWLEASRLLTSRKNARRLLTAYPIANQHVHNPQRPQRVTKS